MDVPCPRCNSSGLQKVSLAYEEGLYQSDKRAQFRGVLIASGGPGVLVGTSTTKGTSRGAPGLSKPARILPPDRCCRLPLVIWGGIAINYSLRGGENVCFRHGSFGTASVHHDKGVEFSPPAIDRGELA